MFQQHVAMTNSRGNQFDSAIPHPTNAPPSIAGLVLLYRLPSQSDFAEVWIAQPQDTIDPSEYLVVKVFSLPPQQVRPLRKALRKRQLIASRFQLRNVANVLDVGSIETGVYLVREYVLGFTIREVIQAEAARGHCPPHWLALSVTIGAARTIQSMLERLHENKATDTFSANIIAPDNLIIDLDGNIVFAEFWMPSSAQLSSITATSSSPENPVQPIWPECTTTCLQAALVNMLSRLLADLLNLSGSIPDDIPSDLQEFLSASAPKNLTVQHFATHLCVLAEQLQWNTTTQRVADYMSLLFSSSYDASPADDQWVAPPKTRPYSAISQFENPHHSTSARSTDKLRAARFFLKEQSTLHGVASENRRSKESLVASSFAVTSEVANGGLPDSASSDSASSDSASSDSASSDSASSDSASSDSAADSWTVILSNPPTEQVAPLTPSPTKQHRESTDSPKSVPLWLQESETTIRTPPSDVQDAPTKTSTALAGCNTPTSPPPTPASNQTTSPKGRVPAPDFDDDTIPTARSDSTGHAWDRAVASSRVEQQESIDNRQDLPNHDGVDAQEVQAKSSAWDRAVSRLRPSDETQPVSPRQASTRELSPSLRARRCFDEGLKLVRGGDYEAALGIWMKAAKLVPDNRLYQSNLRILQKRIEGAKK